MKEINNTRKLKEIDKMKKLVIYENLLKGRNGQCYKKHGVSLIKLVRYSILENNKDPYGK